MPRQKDAGDDRDEIEIGPLQPRDEIRGPDDHDRSDQEEQGVVHEFLPAVASQFGAPTFLTDTDSRLVGTSERLSGKPRVGGRKRLKAKELCQMCVRLTQLIFRQWFAAITSPLLG